MPVVIKDLETGEEQLIGIAALKDGTGLAQATAVKDLAQERKVVCKICGMTFDTTLSNTGHNIGACVLLELALGRTLLRLACRHHVLELPVKGGFEALITSNAPTVALFDRFAKFWETADHGNTKPLSRCSFFDSSLSKN